MQIDCPHCAKSLNAPPEAAGKTATCKHCGGRFQVPLPVASHPAASVVSAPAARPVVIEQTGKRYKMMQASGCGIAVLFFFVMIFVAAVEGSPTIPFLGIIAGVGLYFAGRMSAWWNHG